MELNPFLIGCGAFMIGFGLSQAVLSLIFESNTILSLWESATMVGLGIVITLYYWNRVRIERIVKEEEDLSKEEQ